MSTVTITSTAPPRTTSPTSQLKLSGGNHVQPDAVGFDFKIGSSNGNTDMEQERTARKEALAAAFRIFAKHDLGIGVVGHLTVRDPGMPDCFWVNPFHVAFSCMRVSDLLLIDHSGNIIQGGHDGYKYNQAAFAIHAVIHARRPDVVAVCHSHSTYGSAFASLGVLPQWITQDSLVFYDDLALYPNFGGVVLAAEESEHIADHLGQKKAIILQNHGLLTVGKSVESAAFWFLYLEKVCKMQLLVDSSRRQPVIIGKEEAQFTAAQTGSEESGRFHFQPYRQNIDRETGRDYVD